jgi:hypothetical protein
MSDGDRWTGAAAGADAPVLREGNMERGPAAANTGFI